MARGFETEMDRTIYKAIRRSTEHQPRTLVDILAGVDAYDRALATHAELTAGLGRLIAAGLVAETPAKRFYDAANHDKPAAETTYSEITAKDYEQAVADYRQQVRAWMDAPETDDYSVAKLILSLATRSKSGCTDADEDEAERLADAIQPHLPPNTEINGYELGSDEIRILIFGSPHQDDVDAIHTAVAPIFHQHASTPGSHIVRCYRDARGEVESDRI